MAEHSYRSQCYDHCEACREEQRSAIADLKARLEPARNWVRSAQSMLSASIEAGEMQSLTYELMRDVAFPPEEYTHHEIKSRELRVARADGRDLREETIRHAIGAVPCYDLMHEGICLIVQGQHFHVGKRA